MANKDVKLLTPELLKKQNEKLNEVQEFSITVNGEDFIMTHDVVFRKSKQHKVLDDLVEFFNEGQNRNLQYLDLATPYTTLLILKHFTSLEVPDDIDEAILLLEVLIDLGVLANILNTLPEDEVTKMFELLTEVMTRFRGTLEESQAEAEALALENKETLGFDKDGEGATELQGE